MKSLTAWNYKGQTHHKWCAGSQPCLLARWKDCRKCPLHVQPQAIAVPEEPRQLFLWSPPTVSEPKKPKPKQVVKRRKKARKKPCPAPQIAYPAQPTLDEWAASNPLDLPIEDFDRNPEPLAPVGEPEFSVWDEPPAEDAIESTCAYCGKYFIGAKNKLYCSISCKKKAYRKRWLARGKQRRVYEERECVICGKMFVPRTDEQKTCGGECNVQYMRKIYGYGIPKNHPVKVQHDEYGDWYQMELERNAPIEHRKEFVAQAVRHLPKGRAMFGVHDCEVTAAKIDRHLFWWRTIALPRQAVLLEIALLHGDAMLFALLKFLNKVRSGRWEDARQALMLSPYGSTAGRAAVENARQIASGMWQSAIPQYVPQAEENEDEESEDYVDPDGYELGEDGSLWEL